MEKTILCEEKRNAPEVKGAYFCKFEGVNCPKCGSKNINPVETYLIVDNIPLEFECKDCRTWFGDPAKIRRREGKEE